MIKCLHQRRHFDSICKRGQRMCHKRPISWHRKMSRGGRKELREALPDLTSPLDYKITLAIKNPTGPLGSALRLSLGLDLSQNHKCFQNTVSLVPSFLGLSERVISKMESVVRFLCPYITKNNFLLLSHKRYPKTTVKAWITVFTNPVEITSLKSS